jgi:hypothetical protein
VPPPSRGITGFDVLRGLIGLLLLLAASLKAYQLATEPVVGTGLLESRWLLIGVIEWELLLGLWLLSGVWLRVSWTVTSLCFAAFAGVSLWKALSGEASCGCFGKVGINPWWTLLIDLAVIASMLRFSPTERRVGTVVHGRATGPRLALVGLVWLIVAIPAYVLIDLGEAGAAMVLGDVHGEGQAVVLKPERWLAKRFPLLDYIDPGAPIAEGKWTLLLYRFNCPACADALQRYRELAQKPLRERGGLRVGLIEVPPYAPVAYLTPPVASGCLRGRLRDVTNWFVETPVEVVAEGGMVTAVRGVKQ